MILKRFIGHFPCLISILIMIHTSVYMCVMDSEALKPLL